MCQTPARRPGRRGATLVETALVLSSVIILFLAIVEYGRFVMIRQAADNATRAGARLTLAANSSDTNSFNYQTTTSIQTAVLNALGGLDTALTPPDIQVYQADAAGNYVADWTGAQDGSNIAVQFSANYTPILPSFGFLPTSVPVTAKCVMRSDGN